MLEKQPATRQTTSCRQPPPQRESTPPQFAPSTAPNPPAPAARPHSPSTDHTRGPAEYAATPATDPGAPGRRWRDGTAGPNDPQGTTITLVNVGGEGLPDPVSGRSRRPRVLAVERAEQAAQHTRPGTHRRPALPGRRLSDVAGVLKTARGASPRPARSAETRRDPASPKPFSGAWSPHCRPGRATYTTRSSPARAPPWLPPTPEIPTEAAHPYRLTRKHIKGKAA